MLWEPENRGAQTAAASLGERIYWNASTREDDVDGQIALVERVAASGYRGLILAPDHSLALITPVRHVLAKGLPIVIVGSPLPIPTSEGVSYVLNDEVQGGRLAAQRVRELTGGSGQIALIGINPDINGIMTRAKSFERSLAEQSPQVRIAVRRMGTFNFAHEQEGAEEMLREHPELDVIVALTSTSTHGAMSSIQAHAHSPAVKVIGFDPDSLPFENPSLDSVIIEDTRAMGERAVRLIHAALLGEAAPAIVTFEPMLVTRENLNSRVVGAMVYSGSTPDTPMLKRSEPR